MIVQKNGIRFAKSMGCIVLAFSQPSWKVTADSCGGPGQLDQGTVSHLQFLAEQGELTAYCMERVARLLACKNQDFSCLI